MRDTALEVYTKWCPSIGCRVCIRQSAALAGVGEEVHSASSVRTFVVHCRASSAPRGQI